MDINRLSNNPVYIIDGARTPFLKSKGVPGPFSASDLAVFASQQLLLRQNFSMTDISEVIMGCVMPSANEANIARLVALRLGLDAKTPAWTVQRNCGSGMQALDSARYQILTGVSDLILAGGCEAMSHAPLMWPETMVTWLGNFKQAKTVGEKIKAALKLKRNYFKPVIALLRGLTDPWVELNMGQTAEILADQFNLTREELDVYALRSHERLVKAQKNDLKEVLTLLDQSGQIYDRDTGVRPNTSLEKLSQLKPAFEKFGVITAGNSSQISDGAAVLLLASEAAVNRFDLPVLGRIVDVAWSGLSPRKMGLGPVFATTALLLKNHLKLGDIDYWEINEAFASTVLACVKAWANPEFCHHHLNLPEALGLLPLDRLNVDGGAIALGHPVGASGARVVLHLLDVLRRYKAKRGVATLCIGGGQGGAMLLEQV